MSNIERYDVIPWHVLLLLLILLLLLLLSEMRAENIIHNIFRLYDTFYRIIV